MKDNNRLKSPHPRVFPSRDLHAFRVTDVTRHRNGISGRSFYSVRFSYVEDERFMPNMLAVMPEEAKMGSDTECFVIDLNDPTSNFRGDNYSRQIKIAIDDHIASEEAAYESVRSLRASSKR